MGSNKDSEALLVAQRTVIADQVRVCRVAKCWNPALARLEVNLKPGCSAENAHAAMVKMLCSLAQGVIKPQQAPKGDLERRIQAVLDKLKTSDSGNDDILA